MNRTKTKLEQKSETSFAQSYSDNKGIFDPDDVLEEKTSESDAVS